MCVAFHSAKISAHAAGLLSGSSPERFFVHSRFDRVVNLAFGDRILTIQGNQVPFTPLSVCTAEFGELSQRLKEKAPCSFRDGKLILGGEILELGGAEQIDCRIPPCDPGILNLLRFRSLQNLASVLCRPDSLAFAATRSLRSRVTSLTPALAEAKELLQDLEPAREEGDFNALADGVLVLAGLGPGLTPAGDDFLTGALAALQYYQWEQGSQPLLDRLSPGLARAAERSTFLSREFYLCALSGQFSLPVLALLTADGPARLTSAAASLVQIGHTSGSDILGGVLWALSILIPDRKI